MTKSDEELYQELDNLLERPINNWKLKEEYIVKNYARDYPVRARVCQEPKRKEDVLRNES